MNTRFGHEVWEAVPASLWTQRALVQIADIFTLITVIWSGVTHILESSNLLCTQGMILYVTSHANLNACPTF
jgi:hypothetical protein